MVRSINCPTCTSWTQPHQAMRPSIRVFSRSAWKGYIPIIQQRIKQISWDNPPVSTNTGPYFVPFANLQDSVARNIPIYTAARSCTILPNFVGCVCPSSTLSNTRWYAFFGCTASSSWCTTERNIYLSMSSRRWLGISWVNFRRRGSRLSGSEWRFRFTVSFSDGIEWLMLILCVYSRGGKSK